MSDHIGRWDNYYALLSSNSLLKETAHMDPGVTLVSQISQGHVDMSSQEHPLLESLGTLGTAPRSRGGGLKVERG